MMNLTKYVLIEPDMESDFSTFEEILVDHSARTAIIQLRIVHSYPSLILTKSTASLDSP